MEETSPCQSVDHDHVQSEGTRSQRSQLPIEHDLVGHACPNCGSRRYSLVIRMMGRRDSGLLAARCSRCREPTMLTLDELDELMPQKQSETPNQISEVLTNGNKR